MAWQLLTEARTPRHVVNSSAAACCRCWSCCSDPAILRPKFPSVLSDFHRYRGRSQVDGLCQLVTFAPQVNRLAVARRRRHCLYVRMQQAEHALSGGGLGCGDWSGRCACHSPHLHHSTAALARKARRFRAELFCAMACAELQQTMRDILCSTVAIASASG